MDDAGRDGDELGQGSDRHADDAQEAQREANPPGRPLRAVERLDPHPHGDDQHDGHVPRRREQGHQHQRPTRTEAPRRVSAAETECVAVIREAATLGGQTPNEVLIQTG